MATVYKSAISVVKLRESHLYRTFHSGIFKCSISQKTTIINSCPFKSIPNNNENTIWFLPKITDIVHHVQ